MTLERSFGSREQESFAAVSGDFNPIHVDPVAVRRTLPARLVVHGVHILFWALGVAADEIGTDLPPVARIRVRFLRFTYVDDRVSALVTARSGEEMRLRVTSGDVVRAEIRITFGAATARTLAIDCNKVYPASTGPLDHRAASIDGRRGLVPFVAPAGALVTAFPAAARWIGAERLDALAAATRLVGMIYPGLHSVLGGIDVRTVPEDAVGALAFEMGELRHGQIDASISGGGIVGTLDCRTPNPPVIQPTTEALRHLVVPDRYSGAHVLVVGGSRGIGEVSAKLLALGGADVVVTYRDGATEAAAVAADIERAGGRCVVRRYDAENGIDDQLGDLAPTHACWFATPVMSRPDMRLLDEARFAEAWSILVAGFLALATALHARHPEVRLLYPSLQWIDAPPHDLAEYVMAKAAGEVLSRSIEAGLPKVRVLAPRLPAMTTDQTARMSIPSLPVAETMLPHIDRLILSD
ncbi:SDR family NAD(P)-dependent oxidoreductase [Sphingomonas sp.]|uniref:SDR family NAD(P)-dependent oxidoreductase n=1 Tax=Sphingomonas sp. TaxID=28214 RepID=UPI003AFF80AE